MSRENNKYFNTVSGEKLNSFEFNQFIKNEAKRQFEECSGESFETLTIDEREECYLEQYTHQLNDMEWICL